MAAGVAGWRERLAAWRTGRRRARERLRALRDADAVVVSYGKSGRTWLRAMLSHLYHRRYGLPEGELLDGGNFHVRDRRVPRVLFTHDNPSEPWNRGRRGGEGGDGALAAFGRKRVVFLARDPRDVAVSHYHHMAKRSGSGPGKAPGTAAAPVLFEHVALRDGGKLRRVIAYLNAWADLLPRLPRALFVTYEELVADPHGALGRVAGFLDGRPFTAEEIARAVEFAALDSLREKERSGFFASFRLRPGDAADPQSYKVRRGAVGGYREDLTAEQAAVLDSIVAAELSPFYGYAAGASVARGGGAASTHGGGSSEAPGIVGRSRQG